MLRTGVGLLMLGSLIGCADDGVGAAGGEGGGGGDDGIGANTAVPLACSLEDVKVPLCEGDGCPFSLEGNVVCDRYAELEVEALPSGAPTLLLSQDAPLPVLQVDTEARELRDLFPASIPIAAAVGAVGDVHLFDAGFDTGIWRYQSPTGVEETLASQPGGYFAPIAASWRDEKLSALAQRDGNGLWLATRAGTEPWAVEELDILGTTSPAFDVADDGTPLIGYFNTEDAAWVAHVRAGDGEAVALPFDIGNVLESELVLIPGPSSWQAGAMQLPSGIEIATPDLTHAQVPSSGFLSLETCGGDFGLDCSGTCVSEGTGGVAGFAAFATASGPVVAFVEAHVARQYTLAEGDCGGAGCDCVAALEADSSFHDLVLVRLDLETASIVEIGRYSLASQATPFRVLGAQRGTWGAIAIMYNDGKPIRFARVDLTGLATP